MYFVLSITLPFFAIIFLGTFFSFFNIFNQESSKILTKFALYITLPPFMFINIIKSSTDVHFNLNFIIPFEIVTIILLITSFLYSYYFLNNNKKNSSIFALNSSYPNYGYMGIPLCILAFSEKAAVPLSLILIIDSVILLTFTGFFITYDNKKLLSLYKIIINFFKNPILIGSFLGLFSVHFNFIPNINIVNFLEILANAATPCALFAIGINLYSKINKNVYSNITSIFFLKLFVHPLLMFSIFYFLAFDVDPLWIKVAILSAGLPVAGNVFAMSIYYNVFIKETSSSIMITTIMATFSVPILLFLLLNFNF